MSSNLKYSSSNNKELNFERAIFCCNSQYITEKIFSYTALTYISDSTGIRTHNHSVRKWTLNSTLLNSHIWLNSWVFFTNWVVVGSNPVGVTWTSDMAPALSKEFYFNHFSCIQMSPFFIFSALATTLCIAFTFSLAL